MAICMGPVSIARKNGKGPKDRVTVPCGKCVNCLEKKRADWSFRLGQELKISDSAFFITLTYEDSKLTYNANDEGCLVKRDVQLFLKRLRRSFDMKAKYISMETGKMSEIEGNRLKIRYYIVGEYGTKTNRPHYHGIFYNLPQNCEALITDTWGNGNIQIGSVTPASIHYVTKYCITMYDDYINKPKPFSICSTKPAIGRNYLDVAGWSHKKNGRNYTYLPGGIVQRLPRYYSDRIFNRAQKKTINDESLKNAEAFALERYNELNSRNENYFESELTAQLQKTKNVIKRTKKTDKL